MKLTHLDLPAFRSCRGLQIPLDANRVLIAGLNGAGKTSIADAITWGLIGRCRGTDGRGAGAEVLIPEGEKSAEVGVTVEGIGRVSRSFAEHGGGAFSVEDLTGTSQIQQQALYIKLQTTPEFLAAVLDTSAFLDLTHIDAKALVLSLLNVKIPVGDRTYTLDEIDVKYKQAFEDRKVSKRTLASAATPVKPADVQMPTVDAIEAQLAKLRTALGELRQSVGSVSGKRQALTAEAARLQTIPDAGEDLSGEIDGVRAQLASLENRAMPAAVQPAKGDPQRMTFLKGAIVLLEQHDPKQGCVIDRSVPCKTARKAFEDRNGELQAELTALEAVAPAASQPVTESPLTTLRRRLTDLESQQAIRTAVLAQASGAQDRLKAIHVELDGLPDTDGQATEIAGLEGRIAKGDQLLRDARAHWSSVTSYTQAETFRATLKAEVDRYEALVEELGPNGARVKALASALATFEAAVNPYVKPFGWTISFQVEPWGVFANGRPVETYSESEQLRLGIALQLGVAQLSGLNFAIVDRVDTLDLANRALVSKMLFAAPLEQIIIIGTREPSQALPVIDGVIAYRLGTEQGHSAILERTGGA